MIPRHYIIEWSKSVPWVDLRQVEQDLIITNSLLKIYAHPILKTTLAFRGGTALNKLIFNPPSRYSEDIDLVQTTSQPIGTTIDFIREIMDNWLGSPKRDSSNGLVTLSYRTTNQEGFPIKLKIEINTREHFSVLGFKDYKFSSNSSWATGNANILSYAPEELLGTKMRALYQRRKGRDLYDLYIALTTISKLNTDAIVHCFSQYTSTTKQRISKELFLANMESKLLNKEFREDINPLLPRNIKHFDPEVAYHLVKTMLIEKL